mmetsp:Transcript_86123/g.252002  ORF Transcript_86123/g.252002 Transcript_86123/m.252002 type:complete len:843 (-) Transcript_86123:98-2626(-)
MPEKKSSWCPRGRVYFPKFVCINNPRLALLYWVVTIIVMGIAIISFAYNENYLGRMKADAEVFATSWRLARPMREILSAANGDMNRPHCVTPGSSDYAYGSVNYTGITCAPICSAGASQPCVTPGELYHVKYGRDFFFPTLFVEETFDATMGNISRSNHFVPAVEGSILAFSHQYTLKKASQKISEAPSFESGHSSDADVDQFNQVLTVLLGRDGTEVQRWPAGQAIVLTMGEIFQHVKLAEYSDEVSRMDLDSKYSRVDEDIIDEPQDAGVSVRVSGATIYADLHYTNEGACKPSTGDSRVYVNDHAGKVACMTLRGIRHFVSDRVEMVLDEDGSSKIRQYNGIRIEFRTTGEFTYLDGTALSFAITTLLVWYQIPLLLIYIFITTVLGKLSEIYSRVIHQSMSIKEAVTGLGSRLVGHSSAYLDLAESGADGIDKMRMIERFRKIFADNEELDDDEVVKLVDYIHDSMTGQAKDEEAPNSKVLIEHFCASATSNEPLSFGSIVHIFDQDRSTAALEGIFNDEAIQAIREGKFKPHGEFEEEEEEEQTSTEHSQLDTVSRTIKKLKARYQRLTNKVDKTLGTAEQTLSKDADNLFEHRRRELVAQGSPESRPPMKMASGATYHGDWVGNTRHGYGIEVWPDGATYEGQWAAGRLHGHAVYRQPNGAKYAGQWINGKQHGKGVHVSESGAKYEGQFQHGLKNGKGRIYLVDGSTYEGEVVDNNMHGPGYYEWIDGKSYKGEWVNNLMHGDGTYRFNDGCEYTGQYIDNEKQGHGVFKWPDGKRYEGQYVRNKRSGNGIFIMPDGTRIEGTWKDGKQDGPGTVTAPNGKLQKARWDMGILVQS